MKHFRITILLCAGLVFPWLATAHSPDDLARVLERVMPAVVHVESESAPPAAPPNRRWRPFFEQFFGEPPGVPGRSQRPRRPGATASGSGVIVDADPGHVITNHHVIAAADSIVVVLSDGRRYDATVVGADPETDIAILKIEADELTELPLGDSEKLRVGDSVYAVGSPFGLSRTVTSGIVSALSRSGLGIESYEDFIQTDAAINRGNSGGALVNSRGELVGINTAILGAAGGNIGIGFAIPVNTVSAITEQLLDTGRVQRGHLGIVVQVLTPDLARAFDIDQRRGIIIAEVRPDSAAEKAGLQAGDVIVSVNGRLVENHRQIKSYIGLRKIGEKVEMEVLRAGEKKQFTAIISARELRDMPGESLGRRFSGVLLENFAPDGDAEGVFVKSVREGSRAYQQGLRGGDVIVAINGARVANLEELSAAVDSRASAPAALLVNRRGRSIFIAL